MCEESRCRGQSECVKNPGAGTGDPEVPFLVPGPEQESARFITCAHFENSKIAKQIRNS